MEKNYKKTPEFAEQALDSIHNIMKLDKVNANVLHSYFDTLDSIATVRGDLSDKIFEMIEDGFKSNENDYSSKRMGYVVVHNLGKHNPLQFKMDMLRKKLKDNIGKTASKENGEVSPENKETAKEQTTMSKTLMKAQRYMQGKHNY